MLELQWGLNSFMKQISGYGVARIMLFENCRFLQGLKKITCPQDLRLATVFGREELKKLVDSSR